MKFRDKINTAFQKVFRVPSYVSWSKSVFHYRSKGPEESSKIIIPYFLYGQVTVLSVEAY